jgi:hypothetical protein
LILNNIIDNIGDFKYRTIKVANKSVNNKVLSKSGGLEYLLACGFQVQIDESGTKVLVLPVKENDTISMQNSLEWLKVTSKSCCDIRNNKLNNFANDDVCCECTIQIRLPTGATVCGGFMRGDTLQDVLNYAACYFQADR